MNIVAAPSLGIFAWLLMLAPAGAAGRAYAVRGRCIA
jgi:drug/metabolite transporter superfamily protein YnfA